MKTDSLMKTGKTVSIGRYIISAFPGTGKTMAAKKSSTRRHRVIDLESSGWSHDENGRPSEDFPKSYVNEAIRLSDDYSFILVSSHEQVRRELERHGIRFIYVIPEIDARSEYLQRYRKRGNSDDFINAIDKNWTTWLSPGAYMGTDIVMRLQKHQYISDIIHRLKYDASLRKRIGNPKGMF